MTPWQIIVWSIAGFALLTTAVVQAILGNWEPAIFFALLWIGLSNNTGNTILTFAVQRDPQKLIKP